MNNVLSGHQQDDVPNRNPAVNLSASSNPTVVMRGVSKAYGKKQILRELDWEIPAGAVVGLLGVNGSGKSTLIRCLLGLLKPDSGTLTIDGHDVWDLPDETKAQIGYVDQQPQLFPWMKGRQLLKHLGSFYPDWNQTMLEALAERWKTPLNQTFGSLSPGQQHTLAILSALGNDPNLLVLDEPVSSLDPIARRDFLKSLLDHSRDGQRTILFSTHITSDLERVASHVAILVDGKIKWFDELDNLKDRVKRWRIHGRDELPADLTVDGAIHVKVEGRSATVVVTDAAAEAVAVTGQRYDAEVSVEDLNLEEIFMELHGEEAAE